MNKFRRLRRFVVSLTILALLVGAGIVVKNIVLRQIRVRIESTLHYAKLRLTVIPPAIILEDVRSATASPYFSAQKVVLRFSYLTLFKRDRPLTVFIDQPVVRLYEADPSRPPAKLDLRLPFSIQSGYILNGDFSYWSRGVSVRATGLKAAFRQVKDSFTLEVLAPEATVRAEAMDHPVNGRIQGLVEGRGNRLSLHRLTFDGPDILVKLNGLFFNADRLTYDLQALVHAPAGRLADFLNLPFIWDGQLEAEGKVSNTAGALAVSASVRSPALRLNGDLVGRVEGPLIMSPGPRGTLRLTLHKESAPVESVDIDFRPGLVEGTAKGFRVDPIVKDFRIPWPVRSPVDGTFRVESGLVRVKASFVDDPAALPASGRFAFRGPIDLTWNGRQKRLDFSSEKLETVFGTLRASGRVEIGGEVGVVLNGNVSDVRQARAFTSLILRDPLRFPEIRGRGTTEVKILGPFRSPQVKIGFSLAPAGFAAFNAAAVDGLLEVAGGEVTGLFKVDDPDAKGDLRLAVKGGEVVVRAQVEDAQVERILTALNLSLPFKGRASGDLTIRSSPAGLGLTGNLKADVLEAAGLRLTGVTTGLGWSSPSSEIRLTDLEAGLFGGRVFGRLRIGFADKTYDADLKAEGMDLAGLTEGLRGTVGFALAGRGSLDGEFAKGPFAVKGLGFRAFGPADASGTIEAGFQAGRPMVRMAGKLDPGGNEISASFTAPGGGEGFVLSARGHLLNPALFGSLTGVQAELDFLADVRGGGKGIQVDGAVDIKGKLLPIPGFPHALTDFSALIRVQNNKAALRSFQGRLAGGEVQGTGEVRFGSQGLETADLSIDGRSLTLVLIEGTRMLADIGLRLEGTNGRLALSGNVDVRQLSWRREFSDKLVFAFSPRLEPKAGRSLFDGLALDIRLRADENVLLENAMGRIQSRFDLTLAGTVEAPVVLGEIEALRGEVFFQGRTFRILKGRLSFFNPASIEPYLDFRGETFLKDYRVTFSLSGRMDRLQPEFASSPPLPPEDVLALLALGESFKRTYSYEASAQMGTGSLLSFQLAEQAQKRAEKLFALDSLRIDPFVLGASTEMTARLTVGKKISRNIILLYSTNLTSQREDLIRLEWDFTQSFALVAVRDERGRLSLDVKVRKRF
ncbi:MAG: translocation/assembly module TamB domain-containing protein [Candidatus Aminicenantes bacterium]|nr:translocation/assembly module TamB domain-containing protein [Candidatus Aminicenantes bacterium]